MWKKLTIWFLPGRKCVKKSITLKSNSQDISEVMKTIFQGVIIDNKVNWKDHINYIAGKISRGIGMIIKARKYIKETALIILYYSFIYPILRIATIYGVLLM